jgi:acetyl esterase/lipase
MRPHLQPSSPLTSVLCLLSLGLSLPVAPAAPAVPAGITPHIYKKAGGRELRAYVVNPPGWKTTDKRPAFVFFHGGGFIKGNPLPFTGEQGACLASRGMVVVAIEYRLLKPGERIAPVVCNQDAKSAMRWVRVNAAMLGVDPDRICAAGGSAGGEMAAFAALTPGGDDPADDLKISAKPAALVLLNPAIAIPDDLSDQRLTGHFGNEGGNYYRQVAPASHLDAKAPPMLVLSGEKDRLVPMEFLKKFQARARELGVRCDAVFYAGQGHAFFHKNRENGKYYYETLLEIDKFLSSLGWLQGSPTLKLPAHAAPPERAPVKLSPAIPAQSEIQTPKSGTHTSFTSPILLHGDARTAYRDPLLIHHEGVFHLYYSYVLEEEDRLIYWYVAVSTSTDLKNWNAPRILTPKDQNLNYSSPGNIVRIGDEWVMCLQTYPIASFRRGDKLRFCDARARVCIMRSKDLLTWTPPELIRVKGPAIPEKSMGKMIDPFLLRDKDTPGQWWCFYKQDGHMHASLSTDLKTWTPGPAGIAEGENACVLVQDNEYVFFYAPANGVGVKRGSGLGRMREDTQPLVFGQKNWPWAETRLTAGYVEDLRHVPGVGKYVMVFHGMGPGKTKTDANTNANCSIGIAWSEDLQTWHWPDESRKSKAYD